ncbi:hypothetical protein J4481_00450 [Candidatus Pacearchaeota archaeon]|nr:hypothetical protein [Candidatus Pacearchaeota archaeon]
MATVTLTIPDETKAELKKFYWVNWSLTASSLFKMRSIFEKYMHKEKLSKEDFEFCKLINWHPVDELPLKKEYIQEMLKIEKMPHKKTTLNDLDRLMNLK